MKCENCNAGLPENAKFCSECGTKVRDNVECGGCGEPLKPNARFCHNCGQAVADPVIGAPEERTPSPGRATAQKNWFASIGPFLFIPIFAGIIILLFWQNRDPEPMSASPSANGQPSAPSMAAMNAVHKTLERLKSNLEANPEDLVSLDSLAIMYTIAGSYDKASTYYERHLKIEPDSKQVKIKLGVTYHSLGRTDEGLALIQDVLNEEPTHAFALFYAGELYAVKGDLEVASEKWNKIIENYPETEIAKMAQQRIHEWLHTDSNNTN